MMTSLFMTFCWAAQEQGALSTGGGEETQPQSPHFRKVSSWFIVSGSNVHYSKTKQASCVTYLLVTFDVDSETNSASAAEVRDRVTQQITLQSYTTKLHCKVTLQSYTTMLLDKVTPQIALQS